MKTLSLARYGLATHTEKADLSLFPLPRLLTRLIGYMLWMKNA